MEENGYPDANNSNKQQRNKTIYRSLILSLTDNETDKKIIPLWMPSEISMPFHLTNLYQLFENWK